MVMARDVEEALDKHQAHVAAEPAAEPTSGWLNRTVKRIAKSARQKLGRQEKAKAVEELSKRIRLGGDQREKVHGPWSKSFVSGVADWRWFYGC